MPQNVVSSSIFTDPIRSPADGDVINGASVLQPVQALANRTSMLKADMEVISSGTWIHSATMALSGTYGYDSNSYWNTFTNARNAILSDPFIATSSGSFGWIHSGTTGYSVSAFPSLALSSSHLGVYELSTAASSGSIAALLLPCVFSGSVVDRFKFNVARSSNNGQQFAVGMCVSPTLMTEGDPQNTARYAMFTNNGGSWSTKTRNNSTPTVNATGVSSTNGAWQDLEVRRTIAGWDFYINGSRVSQHSTGMVSTSMGFFLWLQSNGGATTKASVDAFYVMVADQGPTAG